MDVMALPGIRATVNIDHIKRGYYSIKSLNPNGIVPVGVFAVVDARRFATGSPVTTEAQAFYVEDNWSVTQNLLLNLPLAASAS